MFRIKGSHAYSHGCYIRPGEYVELWRTIKSNARALDISISEYVSHSMHLFLYGRVAKMSRVNDAAPLPKKLRRRG